MRWKRKKSHRKNASGWCSRGDRLSVWGALALDEMIRVPMRRDSILCGTNEVNNGFWLGNRLALTSRYVESLLLRARVSEILSRIKSRNIQHTVYAWIDCTDYTEESTTLLSPQSPYSSYSSDSLSILSPLMPSSLFLTLRLAAILFPNKTPLAHPDSSHSRTQTKLNLIMINQGSLHRDAVIHKTYIILCWSTYLLLFFSLSTNNKVRSRLDSLPQWSSPPFLKGNSYTLTWTNYNTTFDHYRLKDDRSESEKTSSTLDAKARDHPQHNGKDKISFGLHIRNISLQRQNLINCNFKLMKL